MQSFHDIMKSWTSTRPQVKVLLVSLCQLQVEGEDEVSENCKVTYRVTDLKTTRVSATVDNIQHGMSRRSIYQVVQSDWF